jgi:hypothetical protein
MRKASGLILASALAATAVAQDQAPQLKARELFYNPIVPAKKQESPAKQDVPVQPVVNTTKETPKAVVKPVKRHSVPKQPISTDQHVSGSTPAQHEQQPPVSYKTAALSEPASLPLAFRYTIQRKNSGGKFEDASVDSVFRSGDRVRVTIESNDNAYLYIVQQGSRKTWNVLFPAPDINDGVNAVKANSKITIPSEHAFSFDEQPGTENVYIVLSRKPESDFEKLIFALHDKSKQPGDGQAVPANTPRRESPANTQWASSRSNNPLLVQLESMKSRDLVFEKVDDENDQGRKDKAFYAGTPDTSANARVVARIELKHE